VVQETGSSVSSACGERECVGCMCVRESEVAGAELGQTGQKYAGALERNEGLASYESAHKSQVHKFAQQYPTVVRTSNFQVDRGLSTGPARGPELAVSPLSVFFGRMRGKRGGLNHVNMGLTFDTQDLGLMRRTTKG
jgi:hypothetical protein